MFNSFKEKDLPIGFPDEYRQYARYGQQSGKSGRPTFFYSQEVLLQHLNVKIIHSGESNIRATDVPFEIVRELNTEPKLGLSLSGSSFCTKMERFYFEDAVV